MTSDKDGFAVLPPFVVKTVHVYRIRIDYPDRHTTMSSYSQYIIMNGGDLPTLARPHFLIPISVSKTRSMPRLADLIGIGGEE